MRGYRRGCYYHSTRLLEGNGRGLAKGLQTAASGACRAAAVSSRRAVSVVGDWSVCLSWCIRHKEALPGRVAGCSLLTAHCPLPTARLAVRQSSLESCPVAAVWSGRLPLCHHASLSHRNPILCCAVLFRAITPSASPIHYYNILTTTDVCTTSCHQSPQFRVPVSRGSPMRF